MSRIIPTVEAVRAIWYGFLRILVQPLFCTLLKYRAFGREHVPRKSGVLIVSNHQSYMDPLLIGVGLARQVHFMARSSLFYKSTPFRWLILSLNAFPLKDEGRDPGAIKEAIRRIKGGNIVLIFPEGTRTYDGSIGEIHPGIEVIAHRTGLPVVPAVIQGAFEAWPRSKKLFRLWPIKVAFGLPIYYNGSRGGLAQEVKLRMLELQGLLRRKG